jgi:hypothetical protein
MTVPGNRENLGRPVSTADLVSAARAQGMVEEDEEQVEFNDERTLPGTKRAAGSEGRRATQQQADVTQRQADVEPALTPPASNTRSGEALVALFTPELTETYRSRWVSIQSSFVDDPRQAVRSGDELVAEVMTNLANTFAAERHQVEGQLDETGEGSTENLRLALRRYRSFFDRLLSL